MKILLCMSESLSDMMSDNSQGESKLQNFEFFEAVRMFITVCSMRSYILLKLFGFLCVIYVVMKLCV